MKPWTPPMKAPTPMPISRAMTHMNGKSTPMPDRRQPVGHQQRVDHGDQADERPDRQVDVARHDDQHHAGRDDGDAGGLDGERDHVGRRDELAAAQDMEAEQDHDQGDQHAEQTEVDLRLGEEAADRRSGGRLGLSRVLVSCRPRSSPPTLLVLDWKATCAPGRTPGRRRLRVASGRRPSLARGRARTTVRRRPCRSRPWWHTSPRPSGRRACRR